MLTSSQISKNREEIVNLLRETGRNDIERVIDALDRGGFFTARPHNTRHHKWHGGIADHSLGVYRHAARANADGKVSHDSVVIAALLHDICKMDGIYTQYHGHGRRSMKILQHLGLELTEDERLAIRWHMGGKNATSERDLAEVAAAKRTPLYHIVHNADHLDARGGHAQPASYHRIHV